MSNNKKSTTSTNRTIKPVTTFEINTDLTEEAVETTVEETVENETVNDEVLEEVTDESSETIETEVVSNDIADTTEVETAVVEESQNAEEENTANVEEVTAEETIEPEVVPENTENKVSVKEVPMEKVGNSDTWYIIISGMNKKEKILSRLKTITSDIKENTDGKIYIGPFFSRSEINQIRHDLSRLKLCGHLKLM